MRRDDDLLDSAENIRLDHRVQPMVEAPEPSAYSSRFRLRPMIFEIGAVAEMRVGDIAKNQIAFDHLPQIVALSAPDDVQRVTDRRQQVITQKEQRQRALESRDSHPADALRVRVLEFHGEYRKVILPA